MHHQVIDLFIEELYFQFGLVVDFIVVFAALAVFLFLSVLAHHDDGGLYRG